MHRPCARKLRALDERDEQPGGSHSEGSRGSLWGLSRIRSGFPPTCTNERALASEPSSIRPSFVKLPAVHPCPGRICTNTSSFCSPDSPSVPGNGLHSAQRRHHERLSHFSANNGPERRARESEIWGTVLLESCCSTLAFQLVRTDPDQDPSPLRGNRPALAACRSQEQ